MAYRPSSRGELRRKVIKCTSSSWNSRNRIVCQQKIRRYHAFRATARLTLFEWEWASVCSLTPPDDPRDYNGICTSCDNKKPITANRNNSKTKNFMRASFYIILYKVTHFSYLFARRRGKMAVERGGKNVNQAPGLAFLLWPLYYRVLIVTRTFSSLPPQLSMNTLRLQFALTPSSIRMCMRVYPRHHNHLILTD